MADRVFKGKLRNVKEAGFAEASPKFNTEHKGGLVPFDLMAAILTGDNTVDEETPGQLHISSGDAWVTIGEDGTIEIGISGV